MAAAATGHQDALLPGRPIDQEVAVWRVVVEAGTGTEKLTLSQSGQPATDEGPGAIGEVRTCLAVAIRLGRLPERVVRRFDPAVGQW